MTTISYRQPPELHGGHVALAPLARPHLENLQRWRADPDVTRFWITQVVPTTAALEDWLARSRKAGNLLWLIQSEAREPIGYIDLFNHDADNRKAEVSLMIGERRVWGQGYGRDALATLLRHAFAAPETNGLGLHKVSLTVFAENVAARRVYQACGFREDGVLREDMYRDGIWHDQVLMSVLEHEFRPLDAERGAER